MAPKKEMEARTHLELVFISDGVACMLCVRWKIAASFAVLVSCLLARMRLQGGVSASSSGFVPVHLLIRADLAWCGGSKLVWISGAGRLLLPWRGWSASSSYSSLACFMAVFVKVPTKHPQCQSVQPSAFSWPLTS